MIIFIFLKLSYGFWYYQPVFHLYDIRYYFFPCGIIEHGLPEMNKYTNLREIETVTFDQVLKNSHKLDDLINIVQSNYLRNAQNIFCPKKENIVPYFSGHKYPCLVSFFSKEQLLQNKSSSENTKENSVIKTQKVVGVMTARPAYVMIQDGRNTNKWNSFCAYYVDYLCVNIYNRKKGTAGQLIQTTYYNQRRLVPNIHASLFKREGKLTGIIPLCVYKTLLFSMERWTSGEPVSPIYNLIKCSGNNIRFLLDFMKQTRILFDVCITTDTANVLELLQSENIYIYYLVDRDNEEIRSVYFFRKLCTSIDKDKECLLFFGSIHQSDETLFIQGFYASLKEILSKTKFHYLSVENISHNWKIVNHLKSIYKEVSESPTAYFFYNFAGKTFPSDKVFINL